MRRGNARACPKSACQKSAVRLNAHTGRGQVRALAEVGLAIRFTVLECAAIEKKKGLSTVAAAGEKEQALVFRFPSEVTMKSISLAMFFTALSSAFDCGRPNDVLTTPG